MSTEHTEEDLRALIQSFKEGLTLYSSTLTSTPLSQLKTQTITDADQELIKVSKILSAHATKIGIAFRPPVSINASYEQIKETSQKMLLIVGATSQFENEVEWSLLFQKEVISTVQDVISSYIAFLDELEALDFKEKKETAEQKEGVDGRLVSVGKVWDSCKTLQALMEKGKLGLLKDNIKMNMQIIDDALDEFTEWIENPEVMNDFDPFGLGDANDDDKADSEEEEEKSTEIDSKTLELAKVWTDKIKMLKLLMSSLSKSLPASKDAKGSDVDEFNKEQDQLVAQVDDLVAAFFMNSGMPEIKTQITGIQKKSELLITLVRKLNKDDDKKTKWLDLWQEKFIA
ncbi:CYFA0S41e00122g1_1 [Cyberlindnera fabianii]|uniref:CYFA0S41e00122g1_1 n=1 Tax=Cyberlindnera fabianii TaxID=36022 RepID=A0A061BJ92_CYBFA|nr:CYFA0S41e00122g1_1 [Cyberlindnera fabianii]